MISVTTPGPRFSEAVRFAAECHEGQYRKGTTIPYISHPIAVAAMVLEDGGDEDQAIAAVLHDTIEDCPGVTEEVIGERFGDTVADLVVCCTKSRGAGDQMAARFGRPPGAMSSKTEFVWRIRQPGFPVEALTVAIADKCHNASAISGDLRMVGEGLWSRFNASRAETIAYYEGLVAAFRERSTAGFETRWLGPFERTVEGIAAFE